MSRHVLTTRGLAATAALILAAACSGTDAPASAPSAILVPTPIPPPSATSSSPITWTGTIYEYTAAGTRRPVPNLRLEVLKGSRADGAVGGTPMPDVITDQNGRFEIPNITSPVNFVRTMPGSSYRFLCDYFPLNFPDLPVVHVSWAGNELPAIGGIPGTSVFGTVTERVDATVRPVAGATVMFESGDQDPPATTNQAGFYMICSVVGTDQYRTITARKDGYQTTSRQIFGGWDTRIDLELAR